MSNLEDQNKRTKLTGDEMEDVSKAAMKYLTEHPSINNRTLRSLTGIGYDQAIHFFKFMLKGKRLRKIGEGSATKYVPFDK